MAQIIVVEDEQELRELLIDELSDHGHDVVGASDGRAGLELINKMRPDLIVSDVNMPKMNGFQMKTELSKADPEIAATPFVFVTAFADPRDMDDGMKLGANSYITKPIDFDYLFRCVDFLTAQ